MAPLPENQGACLSASVHEGYARSVSWEGRRRLGRVQLQRWLPWGGHAPAYPSATLSLAAAGRLSACVLWENPFLSVSSDPASSFLPGTDFSVPGGPWSPCFCSLGGAPGAEASRRTQRSPCWPSCPLYTKGEAREGRLLTWRGCNSLLILPPATCLGLLVTV